MNEMAREDLPPVGSRLPLLFTYRDTLFGNGFVVEVQATNGRALCVRESDGFWMYGVNPGGMAAMGDDVESAHAAFRQAFSNVLVDLALEASNLAAYQVAVRRFFDETNEGYEPEWMAAVRAVRSGEITAPGLPTAPAESPRSIAVNMKAVVGASDNHANLEARIAA
jgi:hypothetical protein